ncbi:MAG: hypothetical protein RL701_2882, partial [Pseudomonadota bacterium]
MSGSDCQRIVRRESALTAVARARLWTTLLSVFAL